MLLSDFVELQIGDWIVQNAANSSVGRAAIQLARLSGIRTVNVVRRSDVIDELKALGGDVVLPDGEDLAEHIAAATKNAPVRLGIDSVGGRATNRIASCLEPGGTLVIYGAMSGELAAIAPGTIVFKDLRVRGLWLSKRLQSASRDAIDVLYRGLDELSVSGRLVAKIDSVFRADDIRNAVQRASQPGIDGKVIVTFN
jgi:NADPH:quinone reductase-like Zn-dependent oxidoreductase